MGEPFKCCMNTPDPGPWKAGVDDGADPPMIDLMHKIRGKICNNMTTDDLIWELKAAVQIDSRTRLGRDIQRCLLSIAADRLTIIEKNADPYSWHSFHDRLRDAKAVFDRRAVCVYIRDK